MKPGSRPFLLYSSVDSERSCYRRWIADGDRNFDVALSVYRGDVSRVLDPQPKAANSGA